MRIRQKITLLLLVMLPIIGLAHNPDQSYIFLRVYETNGIEGKFDIHVKDVNTALGINLDIYATDEELEQYLEEIQTYLIEHSAFSSKYGKHKVVFTGDRTRIKTLTGYFWNLRFYLENMETVPNALTVTYDAFLEDDTNPQQNLLGMEYNWKAGLIENETVFALDFTKDGNTQTLYLNETGLWKGFKMMVEQGAWHIWIGIDHILFLLALILPSVVRRVREGSENAAEADPKLIGSKWYWKPVTHFKPAFMYILKIVTFFTIAHTITLSLGALDIVNLPSRWVESIIALSIGLAAYHNIRPIFNSKDWVIAFVFGLFHGFGFASVLGELGFKGEYLSLSLFGFNLGVELGQIVIIMAIFPILYFMRKLKLYPKFMLWLSVLLIVVSLYWLVERAFEINLPVDDYIRRQGYKFAVYIGLR